MKNEKRMIDANALYEKATKAWDSTLCDECYSEIINLIDEAPTVDAVEVVRCKVCKHRIKTKVECVVYCPKYNRFMTAEHFCSYGERREGD